MVTGNCASSMSTSDRVLVAVNLYSLGTIVGTLLSNCKEMNPFCD